jgi:MSHA pilin protein MshD
MKPSQRGVTLIELVISITIISIAVASVMSALSTASARSAETMLQQQAISIASAYLNDVLRKAYDDDPAVDEGSSRALFDDIFDYNGIDDNGARDFAGNSLAGMTQFRVTVAVVDPGSLGGVPASDIRRIDVTVRHPAIQTVTLSGYRARY